MKTEIDITHHDDRGQGFLFRKDGRLYAAHNPFEIPAFRSQSAIERGVERNILMKTWGGLGDQICAEPTLRYAFETFRDCKISLASECPELFAHLPWAQVFDLRAVRPRFEDFFTFDTIRGPESLQWEFMSHMIVNCVDYPALCAFRCQLPVRAREVRLHPEAAHARAVNDLLFPLLPFCSHPLARTVAVHAGRHWQSKTFPKAWWDGVLAELQALGLRPILIGANTDDNRGTVDVDPTGCIDLRNKLSIMESVALLQAIPVLLTNDSAPLHMAASGNAHIGFVATCKHPDYIGHWRRGQWMWRMENLGLGGVWEHMDYCPNKEQGVEAESVPPELLESWLPPPRHVGRWALDALETR